MKIKLGLSWVCMLVGICIYLLFRSRSHLGFQLLDTIGLSTVVDALREMAVGIELPDFVKNCLPDGLWSISYILMCDYYNRDERRRLRVAWCSVIPLIGCTSELMQWGGILPGIFDWRDLVCYSAPLAVYFYSQSKTTT